MKRSIETESVIRKGTGRYGTLVGKNIALFGSF